jgi:hypothetical protein
VLFPQFEDVLIAEHQLRRVSVEQNIDQIQCQCLIAFLPEKIEQQFCLYSEFVLQEMPQLSGITT